ncbi:MAG TPA: sugar ABC transporter ATP-binding protein [Thermoanaerobaculia bacterium]|nr:sugar ABC transporter ATP-binding protein [Thermoanaerobaculia bacterium]
MAISRDFPGVRALDGVSLTLEKGEVHALCGENGAGKSTLIKVLSGFYSRGQYGGEIRLRGEPVVFSGIRDAEAAGIAVITQELALVPEMTAAENVMLGREPVSRGLIQWDALLAAATGALERVGADVSPDRPVRELGVARRQMVEIAKAVDKRSEILVLDEPTAALAEGDVRRLLDLLRALRREGVSSLYVSHRLEEVFEIADRITVLRDGRVVATAPRSDWTPTSVVAAMVGREIREIFARPRTVPGATALSVADWTLEDPLNPGRAVLDRVSFEAREGEVLGIAGLVGSGRTALATSLFGLARSRVSGTLAMPGRAATTPFRHPAEAIAAGVALVGEDRQHDGILPQASVLENLTLPTLSRYRRSAGLLDDSSRWRDSATQMEALRIRAPSPASRAAALSGGNQQKVVFGKWLLAKPRVLLLDEPTRGVDVGAKAEIHEIVGRLAAEGVAIVLISSELPELLGVSHRVLVLSRGRARATFPFDQATPEAVMAAATA